MTIFGSVPTPPITQWPTTYTTDLFWAVVISSSTFRGPELLTNNFFSGDCMDTSGFWIFTGRSIRCCGCELQGLVMIYSWNEMKWKCIDFKCVRKPAKSRLSLTHMQTNPGVERNNKKLTRRWDSECELSLRRHRTVRTRTTKYNWLMHNFGHAQIDAVGTHVYRIQWNNAM